MSQNNKILQFKEQFENASMDSKIFLNYLLQNFGTD
jgi:hypothetical protein